MNKTVKALCDRGVDSIFAEKLANRKYTLNMLKLMNDNTLKEIGFTDEYIEKLREDGRPPIPEDITSELLYKCKAMCCICKNPENGIIIHHIKPWHISYSHDINNLVVLCPNCHDKVHTRKELSLNWPEKRIKKIKKQWEEEVQKETSKWIRKTHKLGGNRWDYFNIPRFLEIVKNEGIQEKQDIFLYLNSLNILVDKYSINDVKKWKIDTVPKDYLFHPFECNFLYTYLVDLLDKLLFNISVININDIWNKKKIIQTLRVGDIIMYTGGMYFKVDKNDEQRFVYAKKKKIKISSVINAFYSTSFSSYSLHLTGHQSKTYLGIVTNITPNVLGIEITTSTICIGNNFNNVSIV